MTQWNDEMSEATECAWGMFLDTLIRRLGVLGDGEALALVAPAGSTGLRTQLVIRADRSQGFMWVTRGIYGSTAAEEVEAKVGEGGAFELSDAIVRIAREDLRLPHPQLFTARPDGPGAARLAECLGLEEPVSQGPDRGDSAARGGPDDLRPVAVRVVREVIGEEPSVDDDGDLSFDLDGTTVFILFSPDGSAVQVWSMVVRGVYSRRNTAVELDLLNRKGVWNTWYMSGRDVFVRATLAAQPLSAENLGRVLRSFVFEFRSSSDELAYRLGGSAA